MEFEIQFMSPDRLLTEARQLTATGCYEKAFETYLVLLTKRPESKSVLEEEFGRLMKLWNEILYKNDKMPNILYNIAKAIKLYPACPYFYNELGKHMYMCRLYKEACYQFQKSIHLDYSYSAAECNLNSVKNLLVERWHYRMLNDKTRNDAYYNALKEVVKPTDLVFDIGSGTGLLSLYARENKPCSVNACDASEIMVLLAKHIAIQNGIHDIEVFNKMSSDLTSQEIGGQKSLVITELFDAALFGEQILQTLQHAWENLLSNDGRVLPARAEFFVIGAESQYLHSKYHLTDHAKWLLGIPKMIVEISGMEPYDCEDIHLMKPINIKYITEPKSVFKIDFNILEDIKTKLYGDDTYDVSLKAVTDGKVNVIIGWFDLYLTEKIKITTSPLDINRASAWQQPIFYDFLPKNMKTNDSLPIKFTTNGGQVKLYPGITPPVMYISSEMLRFLNDEQWATMISECIASVCIYLAQIVEITEMEFVDLSPFPLFGFLMMKRGAHSLICNASCVEDKEFIMKVFRIHRIPLSKVTILVGDELDTEVFKDLKFHAIFYNILTLSGDYNPIQKELMETLISDHLHERGMIFPHRVFLIVQLVASEWLNINNRVFDKNVHDYKVASDMNDYQVSQHLHLDLTTLPFMPMSEPAVMAAVNSTMRTGVMRMNIKQAGEVDACLCWYKIQLLEDEDMITTFRENSFIDCMAYLADPPLKVEPGDNGSIAFCVDDNGPFKILITPQNDE